jgi:hypothetical protein
MRESLAAAELTVSWRQTTAYRVRQFWRGLNAQVTNADQQRVAAILLPAAMSLFRAMPRDAQRHSLNVLFALEAGGDIPIDLAVAALLHDVGKTTASASGMHLNLWLRGPLVILERLAPTWARRIALDDPRRPWRYALYVHLEHPAIGARLARSAGCSPLACWLIEHHQDEAAEGALDKHRQLLRLLQEADNQN